METKPTTLPDDIGRLALRLAVGGLLLLHGIHMLRHGTGNIPELLQQNQLPAVLEYGIYAGEVVAPILILLGLIARTGGLLVAVTMVFAVYLQLRPKIGQLNEFGGWALELNALYFAGGLAIMFLGAGRLSLSRGRRFLD